MAAVIPVPASHPEFDFHCDPKDWAHVRLLLEDLEEEMANREQALLHRVSVWRMAVKTVRKQTTLRMVVAEPTPRDLGYHKAALATLGGAGQRLAMEVQHSGLDLKPIGISVADVEAMLEELAIQEREWHGDMKEEKRKLMLEEIFGPEEAAV